MALEIVWSKKADRTFDGIIEYLSSEWGENSAKIFDTRQSPLKKDINLTNTEKINCKQRCVGIIKVPS